MRYLVLATRAAARIRSAQMAQAMGCDMVSTRFWWDTDDLLDGTGVVVIDDDRPDFNDINQSRGIGLDADERAALKTRTQLGPTKLRDMLAFVDFSGRLTAAQRTKLQNARQNNPDLDDWITSVQASGMVDLTDPITIRIIKRMIDVGIISATDVDNLMRYQGQ